MGSRLEANSAEVRKRIENHTFNDEEGEEYEASKFGGFADYFRRKKIKLQNLDAELRQQSTQNPPIFRGVVAHVNGYTQPSLSDLHRLIVSYGGGFLQYLDGKTAVTHVIASNLTPKKKVEFARYRIVKPAWIVDSVKAGKPLPWEAYRAVDEGVTQKVLGFDNGQIVSQRNTQSQGYREQTDTSWYTSQVKGLADDIEGNVQIENQSPRNLNSETRETDGDEDNREPSPPAKMELSIGEDDAIAFEDFANALSQDQDELSFSIPASLSTTEKPVLPSSLTAQDASTSHIPTNPSDLEDEASGMQTLCPVSPNLELQNQDAIQLRPSLSPEKSRLSAEEHNAILLSDPHIAKSSTANPDFLNQYYRESRLHHLSTWKADLKAQLQARTSERASSQKQKRRPGARRYIMHVDFDSFFAAVSLRKNPHLVDKPVVIAHGSGPGSEIASCNYPARKFGVKNGMWMKSAIQLCPDLKVLPYDFKAYEEASRLFYEAILATEGIVQSVSIDEALVDISCQCIEAGGSDGKAIYEGSVDREQAKAQEIALQLRSVIKDKTGCDVSIGIGNNILLAKVALRKAKPAGQHLIKPDDVLDFIGELNARDLPGVAYSLNGKLEEIGVKFVKDIRALTKERLINTLGPKTGEKLYEYSRGVDNAEVGEQVIRKSVSAEVNWGIRFVTQQQADEFVQCLCDELSKRLLEQIVKGKQLTVKILKRAADAPMDPPKNLGHGKCDTFNKSVVLGVATNDKTILGHEAMSILRSYGFSPGELRGLGVQMTKLEPLRPSPSLGVGSVDSSQRLLHFKKPDKSPRVHEPFSTSPSALDGSLSKSQASIPTFIKKKLKDEDDPVEEVLTPEKSKNISTVAGVGGATLENDEESRGNLLNLTELPAEIQAKLVPQDRSEHSNPRSPITAASAYELPHQSQIDPEILNALPDDVKSELLAHYKSGAAEARPGVQSQQLLPQSLRKPKPVFSGKKISTTPTKRTNLSTFGGKGKSKTSRGPLPTFTQSNFVAIQNPKTDSGSALNGRIVDEEISQSFLAELPEEIRSEILAEQKRNRMKAKSGLNVEMKQKTGKGRDSSADEGSTNDQRKLKLSPLPEIPTFTSRRLSALPELRDAMTAWVEAFSEEEGPFDEDVDALKSYLEKVIVIESDLEKAVSVVEWLAFAITEHDIEGHHIRKRWSHVLGKLQSGVQEAVKARGLPQVEFAIF